MLHNRYFYEGADFLVRGGCVSRATPEESIDIKMTGAAIRQKYVMEMSRHVFRLGMCLLGSVLPAMAGGAEENTDNGCIDFYTIGESRCAPVNESAGASAPQLVPPPAAKSEEQKVDEFLANYGKPPREFVEFYMNPTPENARKWVATYQNILKKSQNLSQMWSEAEQLYSDAGQVPVTNARPKAPSVTPSLPVPVKVNEPSPPTVTGSSFANIGAFAGSGMAGGPVQAAPKEGLQVTYYFSQTCPYCARMTPELNEITKAYGGKLEFTCVDVTPISGSMRPDPAYLSGKLGCSWRLPAAGELLDQDVRQTPTLVVQVAGKPAVRLSGYMSKEQLAPYFR